MLFIHNLWLYIFGLSMNSISSLSHKSSFFISSSVIINIISMIFILFVILILLKVFFVYLSLHNWTALKLVAY